MKNKESENNMVTDYLKEIYEALSDKLAHDIEIIKVTELTPITDYIIIADASNINQLDAVVDAVYDELAKYKIFPKAAEGNKNSGWVLMDYRDVVINLFTAEQRSFYNIERIWQDGVRIKFE